jgi:hypothetical protein
MEIGLGMTIVLVRKPPIGKMNSERLKIVLAGSHTANARAAALIDQIAARLMPATPQSK